MYSLEGQAGRGPPLPNFCPTCGTTVHWDLDVFPDKIGVVGAFADPAFPAPNRSLYEGSKRPWIELAGELVHLETTIVRSLSARPEPESQCDSRVWARAIRANETASAGARLR